MATPSNALRLALAVGAVLFIAPFAAADITAGIKAQENLQWDVALSEFKKDIATAPTRFEANWRTGQTLTMMGSPKKALKYLKVAIAEKADHAEAQYWWGVANGQTAASASIFSAPGLARTSKKAFEKAIAINPDHLQARAGLMQFLLQAPGIVGGDKDEALVQANEIYARDKIQGLANLVTAHQARGEEAAAKEKADQLVSRYPENPRGYAVRGELHRQADAFPAAYIDFKTLANLMSDDDQALTMIKFGNYQLGAVTSQGRFHVTEGIAALETFTADTEITTRYFENSPLKGYAYFYLADLHFQNGDVAAARTAFKVAQAATQNKPLKKLLKAFKKTLKKAT